MKTYSNFAEYYDSLTNNVDYNLLCEYYSNIISKYGNG